MGQRSGEARCSSYLPPSLAFKIPSPPPPQHRAHSLHFSHQQVNRKWGPYSPRPTVLLHEGWISYPVALRGGGDGTRKTISHKKPGRAQISPTQPPQPPPQAPAPQNQPACQSFTETLDEKPTPGLAGSVNFTRKLSSKHLHILCRLQQPDSLGSHQGTLAN